eukprot:6888862-Ditylum_brightwellii.AAC.1
MEGMSLKFEPEVFLAWTDSRFLRALGIRVLGFSPMCNAEIMLHEDDEYLEEEVFLEGIGAYIGWKEVDDLAAAADGEGDGHSADE